MRTGGQEDRWAGVQVDSRTGGQVDKVESYRRDKWTDGQTGRKTSDCKVTNLDGLIY